MKNSNLKLKIAMEIDKLISASCNQRKLSQKFKRLHVLLIMKYYNATDVTIDYHRKRVVMNIVTDNSVYNPKTINQQLPLLRTNLFYPNLKDFLKSCVEKDGESIAFYAKIIQSLKKRDTVLTAT